jgi:hypothetical protein
MKIKRNIPKPIYGLCVLLTMAFWFVLDSTRMDGFGKIIYFIFLPLTSAPYIMCVIHKEGQEPDSYFKDTYGSHPGLMWFVRSFMMVVLSLLNSVAALLVFGAIGIVASFF